MINHEMDNLKNGEYYFDYYISLGNKNYYMQHIINITNDRKLFDELSIGNVNSQEASIEILDDTENDAEFFEIFVALITKEKTSDYISLGKFYIDNREWGVVNRTIKYHGYDGLIKNDKPYYTMSDRVDANVIISLAAKNAGVKADFICRNYTLPKEDGKTIRDYLKDIATYLGGNIIISNNTLKLIKLINTQPVYNAEDKMSNLSMSFNDTKITKVKLETPDGDFEHGETGYALKASLPKGDLNTVKTILSNVNGFEYRGFNAENVVIPPTVELGDTVQLKQFSLYVSNISFSFDLMNTATIESPDFREIDERYGTDTEAKESDYNNKNNSDYKDLKNDLNNFKTDLDDLKANIGNIGGTTGSNTTKLDFSEWDNGSFKEYVGGNEITYNIDFNQFKLPTKISSGDVVVNIEW